jgi:hypothetical protein
MESKVTLAVFEFLLAAAVLAIYNCYAMIMELPATDCNEVEDNHVGNTSRRAREGVCNLPRWHRRGPMTTHCSEL